MMSLVGYYWYGLLLSMLIGLVTGWWAWGRPKALRIDGPADLYDEPIAWPFSEPVPPLPDHDYVDAPEDALPAVPLGTTASIPAIEPEELERMDEPIAEAAHADTEVMAFEAASPELVVPDLILVARDPAPIEQNAVDLLGPAIADHVEPEPVEPDAEPQEAEELPLVLVAPEPPPGDDLTRIKGIDGEIEMLLHRLGVTRFEQMAGWMPQDIERINEGLGPYRVNVFRDEWIAQARLLARGDMETFAQRYGHL